MLAPAPLLPVIRILSANFPGKALAAVNQAHETLFDVSASLIEVSLQHNLPVAACLY